MTDKASATPLFNPPAHLLPRRTPDNEGYWAAAADGRFVVPQCGGCSKHFFPLSPRCPHCLSDDIRWDPTVRRGVVASWIRYRKPYYPWVEQILPYVGVLLDVVPGVRIPMLAWPTPVRDPEIGEIVEIAFLEVAGGAALPVGQLSPGGETGA